MLASCDILTPRKLHVSRKMIISKEGTASQLDLFLDFSLCSASLKLQLEDLEMLSGALGMIA